MIPRLKMKRSKVEENSQQVKKRFCESRRGKCSNQVGWANTSCRPSQKMLSRSRSRRLVSWYQIHQLVRSNMYKSMVVEQRKVYVDENLAYLSNLCCWFLLNLCVCVCPSVCLSVCASSSLPQVSTQENPKLLMFQVPCKSKPRLAFVLRRLINLTWGTHNSRRVIISLCKNKKS